ncbi:hypothetical protein K2Z84_34690 [Candidatus Binatia bacterium]|nr:hypothetical protein [Candidatus Binatia bacterium]
MKRAADDTRDPLWLTLAVALSAVLVQLPIFDRWFALLDEGYILEIADDINRGNVLYRDVNVDAPFPGAFYLLAWWFRLFGSSVLSSRVLAVAGFALFATAAFRIARALLPRAWSLGLLAVLLCYRVWAFPHWHIYSYSLVSAALLAAAVALVMTFVGRGGSLRPLVAGLLAGAAVMSKQDYGLAVSGLVTLVLAFDGVTRRAGGTGIASGLGPALRFVAGGALVVLPSLAYFAAVGALDDLVNQAFLVPLSGAMQFTYTRLPNWTPLFAQDPALRAEIGSYFPSILATLWWGTIGTGHVWKQTAVWDVALKLVYWAPLLVTGTATVLWLAGVVRRLVSGLPADDPRRLEDARRLVLLAWACGFLAAFNRPRDWVHLMMIYPPSVVVGAVLLERVARRLPRPARVAWGTLCAAPVVALCLVSVLLARDLRRDVSYALATPRGGVRIDPRNGPIIDELLAYVDANVPPGEPLPVYPVQPMLTFLAGRDAAGGFHVIWPVQDPSRDDRIVADLERRRPSTIVYSLSQYQHLGTVQKNAPKLFAYLVEHYEIARVLSREPHGPLVTILRRRGTAPPGESVLDRTAPAASSLTRARWPFADVLTQTVTLDTDPRPAFLLVRVPAEGGTLQASLGINPDRWLGLKSGPFRFAVVVITRRAMSDRGERRLVLEKTIDPARTVADRGWIPFEIDLDDFAGQEILLGLSVSTPNLADEPSDLAGWAEPRIVPRATAP